MVLSTCNIYLMLTNLLKISILKLPPIILPYISNQLCSPKIAKSFQKCGVTSCRNRHELNLTQSHIAGTSATNGGFTELAKNPMRNHDDNKLCLHRPPGNAMGYEFILYSQNCCVIDSQQRRERDFRVFSFCNHTATFQSDKLHTK